MTRDTRDDPTPQPTLSEIKRTTTWLQGMGATRGKPAGELQPNDVMVWNEGATSVVQAVRSAGAKSVKVDERTKSGLTHTRTLRRDRIVACQIDGKTIVYRNVTQEDLRNAELIDAIRADAKLNNPQAR